MTDDAPETVTLALVRTKNGLKVKEIIAFLALSFTELYPGERIYGYNGDMAFELDLERGVHEISSYGLNEGLRDRSYMLPLANAQRRIKEQPRNLKLVAESHTATIWKPQRNRAPLV